MDPHGNGVALGLYLEQGGAGGAAYRVHSYSSRAGTAERVAFITRAMALMGGMEQTTNGAAALRFPCGAAHVLACRRAFLEACKLPSEAELAGRPLCIHDPKAGCTVTVDARRGGAYALSADGGGPAVAGRLVAIRGGLAKLAALHTIEDLVAFDCGHAHDALIGLLLVRAINVRAVMRETEEVASRGVLVAPSAQKS